MIITKEVTTTEKITVRISDGKIISVENEKEIEDAKAIIAALSESLNLNSKCE